MTTQVQPLSVSFFGTYCEEYSRNQIMIERLRQVGMDVIEYHEPLWRGIEDRGQAAGEGGCAPRFSGACANILASVQAMPNSITLRLGRNSVTCPP